MENRYLIAVYIFLLVYLSYKIYSYFSEKNKKFEREIKEVLTSEEFKVKGRFE